MVLYLDADGDSKLIRTLQSFVLGVFTAFLMFRQETHASPPWFRLLMVQYDWHSSLAKLLAMSKTCLDDKSDPWKLKDTNSFVHLCVAARSVGVIQLAVEAARQICRRAQSVAEALAAFEGCLPDVVKAMGIAPFNDEIGQFVFDYCLTCIQIQVPNLGFTSSLEVDELPAGNHWALVTNTDAKSGTRGGALLHVHVSAERAVLVDRYRFGDPQPLLPKSLTGKISDLDPQKAFAAITGTKRPTDGFLLFQQSFLRRDGRDVAI